MTKYILFFIVSVIFTAVNVNGQKSYLPVRDEQKRQLLGMTEQQYTSFSKGIQEYNNRLIIILRDKTMTKEKKKEAFEKLQAERKAHMEKYLTGSQRKQLYDFERNRPEAQRSRFLKLKKERDEQFKKRGLKVITDKNK